MGPQASTRGPQAIPGVPYVDIQEMADTRVADRRHASQQRGLQGLECAQCHNCDGLVEVAGVIIASARVGVAIDHARHEGLTSQVDHLVCGFAVCQTDPDPGNA